MEKLKLSPASFGGEVHIPPSKSFAHRALICGALSGGDVRINNIRSSRDIEATVNFIRALGMEFISDGKGNGSLMGELKLPEKAVINCIESASTLRFILPVMAALGVSCEFTGEGRLPERPFGIYKELLPAHGVSYEGEGLPCKIKGKLRGGDFRLPGNISSQFISGLMFALPLLEEDSRIMLTTEIESGSYIDITVKVLADFGISIDKTDFGWYIKGGQKYKAADYTVEGDWSQAAFYMNLGAFSEEGIRIHGLNKNSIQGDRKCLEIYRQMGVRAGFEGDVLVIKGSGKTSGGLKAVKLNAGDIPDMVPALAVAMAMAEGESFITGAGRLRIKESDRLKALTEDINAIGGNVQELPEGLAINGVKEFTGGAAKGFGDHRILMAISTAAVRSTGDITVTDPYSVNKSYPDFYEDYNSLGGKANVISMG